MGVFARIRDTLSFTTVPTTVVAVLIYAIIFTSVLVTDELPNIPKEKKWKGLNFTRAYADLHAIAARPHPFNVRANDDVRDYILSRVKAVASNHPDYIAVDDDTRTNASWAGGTPLARAGAFGIYFEGTNVLVKIDGTNPNKSDAVLFSAHYDSVSTASGATDDGMGVATLLSLIDYLAERRPKRTAVFNINNGEEDGLHGAHLFMEHPWAKLTKTFLNLEGAAAGGRPLLFRATSYTAARAFRVPHPHTNALGADSFKKGLIKSATDYSVYTAGNGTTGTGLDGLDYAFYKGRSKYHTKWDAIPHTLGGKKALWAMMEGSRATAEKLLNEKDKGGRGDEAIYFDVLGRALVAFPLSWLLAIDIVLLVVGPIAILALLLATVLRARQTRQGTGQPAPQTGAKGLIMVLLGWARFWAAVGVSGLVLALLSVAYTKINPFVIHSRMIPVLISTLSLAYLALVLPLSLTHLRPSQPLPATSSRQQKLAVLLESYVLLWGLLLASAISVGRAGVGSSYFITFWNAALLLGTLLAVVEAWFRAGEAGRSDVGAGNRDDGHGEYPDRRLVRGVRYDAEGTSTGTRVADDGVEGEVRVRNPSTGEGVIVETEPTEITPLIAQRRSGSRDSSTTRKQEEDKNRDELLWWLAQILIVVPFPALLISQIGLLAADSLSQTLIDGSSPGFVYGTISLFSIFAILPLAPFAHKLHRLLTIFIAVVFLISTIYTLSVFPFTPADNLKVYFLQTVELPNPTQTTAVRAKTTLAAVPPYLEKYVVGDLPSSAGKKWSCGELTSRGRAVPGCSWDSTSLLPSPGYAGKKSADPTPDKWITFSAKRTNATNAQFTVSGLNTRSCRLYFTSRTVDSFYVHDSGVTAPRAAFPVPEGGVKEIRLWSRTFSREWIVDVGWKGVPADGKERVEGRVACEWAEYESGAAGGKSRAGGRIPAYEEVLAFLPDWVLATKTMDGLVEAWQPFEV